MRGLAAIIAFASVIPLTDVGFAVTPQDYVDCQQSTDLDRSIDACSRVIDDATTSAHDRAVMYVRRGYARFMQSNLDAAIADYTEAVKLDDQNVYAYINRAIAYARKGVQDQAIADYRRAKSLDYATTTADADLAAIGQADAAAADKVPPSAPIGPAALSGPALVRAIKLELKRIGCYSGAIDDGWSVGETRSAVGNFVKYAHLAAMPSEPTLDFLDELRGRSGRVCSLACGPRQVERDGKCIAKRCRAGYVLRDDGVCETPAPGNKTASLPPPPRQPGTEAPAKPVDSGPRAVVGQSVNWGSDGVATYGRDGSYKYVSRGGAVSQGRYEIHGSQICVTFKNGHQRCDTIRRPAGGGLVLTNQHGRTFMAH